MDDAVLDGMLVLEKILRRERLQKLLVLGIALVGGGLLIGFSWKMQHTSAFGLMVGMGMLAWLVGLRFMRDVWKEWSIRKNPLLYLLVHSPQSFVWVYSFKIQLMPFGIYTKETVDVRFFTINRTMFQIRGSVAEIKILEKTLFQLLPHATFGFNKEREQWYLASPLLLWNDEYDLPDDLDEDEDIQ